MVKSDTPYVDLEHRGSVAIVTIDRPDRLNAYSPSMAAAIADLFDDLDADSNTRAAVFAGTGERAFCAGMDIETYLELSDEEGVGSVDTLLESTHETHRIVKTIRAVELPVVAAVSGYAFGGGMDLALACDFRVVGRDAQLAQQYVNVGLVPDAGCYLLPRLIGEARAKELIMTGDPIGGEEAAELGLAREAIDGDDEAVLSAALEFAERLAEGPTVAIGTAKRMINESFEVSIETALAHAIDGERICHETRDHHEGIQAFDEKREAEFVGE
ncbi:MAG: enoyl-CoA hydratase/isomerase family protein [Halobacteriota archaeon]|uniref:enoyl-CoA hydratase/isomerase family protein n=1 Tax=Natronomonas sp. TaxID=2184060 RepID=UPI0039757ECB